MKTKLLIKERLYLMNVLPQQNSLIEYQLKKSIIQKVEITDEDKALVDFKQEKCYVGCQEGYGQPEGI